MASIVLGLGTSHSPMLVTREEELPRLIERDENNLLPFRDRAGRKISYQDLAASADPAIAGLVGVEDMRTRAATAARAIERLRDTLTAAALDALIVVGDDQDEVMHADNRPSLSVYHGETIANGVPPAMDGMPDWLVRIRSRFYEETPRIYPVAQALARHLIGSLVDQDFDVATSNGYAAGQGEGHALAFVHKYLMTDPAVPVVPVLLNTFYPPNQVTPRRAFGIGRAIRAAVDSFPGDARVGVLASGGLSHFVVDEGFDRMILDALSGKDAEALMAVPRAQLVDGTSETLNWICVGGAVEHLDFSWHEYVAGYRSPAGTGVGLAFGIWN